MGAYDYDRYPGYEAALPWHHRQPFDGVEQFPSVIRREDADCEATFYSESGSLSANVTATGRRLLATPCDVVFVPPGTAHTLQAIGDEPVVTLFAQALAA